MRKSLPLIAGAIVVPLLAATVAAFAASANPSESPAQTLSTATSTPAASSSSATVEAPVVFATTPEAVPQGNAPAPQPLVQAVDDPEPPTTTTTDPTTPTTPVPPNQWPTPAPTTSPPATPVPSGGPIELVIAWDGLKCPRPDSWSVETGNGPMLMCPGSRNP